MRNWDFGSTLQNPSNLFANGPDNEINIQLAIEDDLGCVDTINQFVICKFFFVLHTTVFSTYKCTIPAMKITNWN